MHYPMVMHGVTLSIGSTEPLDYDYLVGLKKLADEIQPEWISDHLCWTGVLGQHTHQLLPVPLTRETLAHIAERVMIVQDFLKRPLVLENPAMNMTFKQSTIAEPDFLARLAAETGCGILLNMSNVLVTCANNSFEPLEYVSQIPADRVVQMHIAKHKLKAIDSQQTPDEIWKLFSKVWQCCGEVTVIPEWENQIPDFEQYRGEVQKAHIYIESLTETPQYATPAKPYSLYPTLNLQGPEIITHHN